VPGGAARQPPPNAARWCARHGLAGATGLTTTFARRPAVTRARRHRAADHARVGPRDRRAPARSSSLRAESRRSSLRRAARPRRGSTRTRRRRAHRTCRSAPGRRYPAPNSDTDSAPETPSSTRSAEPIASAACSGTPVRARPALCSPPRRSAADSWRHRLSMRHLR
jgi:hypothetical protein